LAYGGGFERWVSEVAPRLVDKGHNVTVVTTHAGDIKDKSIKPALVDKGIKVIELDNYTKPFTIPRVKEIARLLEIVREHDILYFNNALAGERIAHESCEDANKDSCWIPWHIFSCALTCGLRSVVYKGQCARGVQDSAYF
jgi:hypothetical protein